MAVDRKRAARLRFFLQIASGNDAVLRGQTLDFDEGVFVENGVAHDEHAETGEGSDSVGQILWRNARGQLSAEFGHFGIGRFEMAVEQSGGAEDHVTEVAYLTAVFPHGGDVVMDIARDVIGRVGIFRSLAVDVRLDRLDRLDRGGVWNKHDVIDTGQRSQGASTKRIIEIRAARPLVDVLFIGHSDHEHVAELFGILQMDDVTGMDQIERAVTLHETFAVGAQLVEERGRFGERDDFLGGHQRAR